MIETGRALPSSAVLLRFSARFGFNFHLTKIYLLKDKIDRFSDDVKEKLEVE